jgi:hypothetical protein
MKYWLGLDIGTGGSRALLVNADGGVAGGVTAPHGQRRVTEGARHGVAQPAVPPVVGLDAVDGAEDAWIHGEEFIGNSLYLFFL